MKKLRKLLASIISLIVCMTVSAIEIVDPSTLMTEEEALEIVKKYVPTDSGNYYRVNNYGLTEYTFFIDPQPGKGWEHSAFIAKVTRKKPYVSIPTVTLVTMPPSENTMTLLYQSNRMLPSAFKAPRVARPTTTTNSNNDVADRTYAIIISGGAHPTANYSRYWNDCSFIYQTLRNRYDIPKENIELFMADGDDPGLDMLDLKDFTYKSSPLDLDFDGVDDLKYSATKANIKSKLESLSDKLKEDDHLFIFVIDHGGTTNPDAGTSYINLWGSERLFDYELADMVKPLTGNLVSVNAVLGQCYSGGFIKELTQVSCVCATACSAKESSYACPNISYDEFVYHWTCAVNGADHIGNPVNADTHRTNFVSMKEAFDYALAKDRRDEHPQYISTPASVGDDLAFNNLAKAVDLYIKDGHDDTGIEPNWTTQDKWKSPSIWIRNQVDSIEEHENPYYSPDHIAAQILVRIHNRGKKTFTGKGLWAHVYWSLAATGLTDASWKGRETFENKVSGEHLRASEIPSIAPGDSAIVRFSWLLPQDLESSTQIEHHYCIWARIMNQSFDDAYDPLKPVFNVALKDQAQKNVSVVNMSAIRKETAVIVRNTSSSQRKYDLEIRPQSDSDNALFNIANVSLRMSPLIYDAWSKGGLNSLDVGKKKNDPYTVTINSYGSKLIGISMSSQLADVVMMRFVPKIGGNYLKDTYTFDLIQRDEDGTIIGGETFIVKMPRQSSIPLTVSATDVGNGQYKLSTEGDPDSNTFIWENQAGEEIGQTSELVVTPTTSNREFSVATITENGEMMVGNISLEPTLGIKSVSANSESNVEVEFYSPMANNNSIVTVTNLTTNANVLTTTVPEGNQQMEIDATRMPSGLYSVTLMVDGENIDSQKFVK